METGISSGLMGHLARMQTLPFFIAGNLVFNVELPFYKVYFNISVFILRPSSAAFECLRAFVLHLLDTEWKVCDDQKLFCYITCMCNFTLFGICIWQGYDHTFVLDVRLPEFLLDTAKGE